MVNVHIMIQKALLYFKTTDRIVGCTWDKVGNIYLNFMWLKKDRTLKVICFSLVGLPLTRTTNLVALTTDIHSLTFLETGNFKYWSQQD